MKTNYLLEKEKGNVMKMNRKVLWRKTYAKWHDLQTIKTTIPKDCHNFYDNLDRLPQKGKQDISLTV